MTLTHLSLFSGIGGLDLAAEWARIRTVGQCEWAEYPAKVLERHWPDVPRWKDIRTLTGESFYARTGRRTVDVVSGGFPCQPFSVAGKRRGKDDDRYLWPEMVRVIREIRPTWVVGENVAGIVRMALPGILSELEAGGYIARTFLVPACAVGALHRRYRVAIVGYAEHNGPSSAEIAGSPHAAGGRKPEREEPSGEFAGAGESGNGGNVADTESIGQQGVGAGGEQIGAEGPGKAQPERVCDVLPVSSDRENGRRVGCTTTPEKTGEPRRDNREREKEYVCGGGSAESGMGGMADGFSAGMDGDLDFIINHYWDTEPDIPRLAAGTAHRSDRLKCLGNAVVPQQFYPVFRAIVAAEEYRRKK